MSTTPIGNQPDDPPILLGLGSIASFMHQSPRRTRHLIEKAGLPVFKLPKSGLLAARPLTLREWLREQEAAALSIEKEPLT